MRLKELRLFSGRLILCVKKFINAVDKTIDKKVVFAVVNVDLPYFLVIRKNDLLSVIDL